MGGQNSSLSKTEIGRLSQDIGKLNKNKLSKQKDKASKHNDNKRSTLEKKQQFISLIRQETFERHKQVEILKRNQEQEEDQFPKVQIDYTKESFTSTQSTQTLQTPSTKSKDSGSKVEKINKKSKDKLQKVKKSNKSLFENDDKAIPKCCSSCKTLAPKKCWRQQIRDQLERHLYCDMYDCQWLKYLLQYLENSKEEISETQIKEQFLELSNKLRNNSNLNSQGKPVRIHDFENQLSYKDKRGTKTEIHDPNSEIGQTVLRLQNSFHDQVLLIKRQLTNKKHPFLKLITIFKKKFYSQNITLLQKFNFEETMSQGSNSARSDRSDNTKSSPELKGACKVSLKVIKNCQNQIHFIVDIIVNGIITFYGLAIRPGELKRDLLVNLATNLILADEVYFLMFNLLSIYHQRPLHKLSQVMSDRFVLENQLNFKELKIKEQFTFDKAFRERYQLDDDGEGNLLRFSVLTYSDDPYYESIESLSRIISLESPMCKLEQIYTSCTQSIINELQLFWNGYNISRDEMLVDSDNLQGILIYIVSRLNYPQIWTEIHLIEEFIPEAVLLSNRAFYMILIRASCEYLINLKPKVSIENDCPLLEIINDDIEFEDDRNPEEVCQDPGSRAHSRQLNLEELKINLKRRNFSLIVSSNIHPTQQSDKEKLKEADNYFFEENCILQDDLIDLTSNYVKKNFQMTVIQNV